MKFFPVPSYRNLTLQCLTEVHFHLCFDETFMHHLLNLADETHVVIWSLILVEDLSYEFLSFLFSLPLNLTCTFFFSIFWLFFNENYRLLRFNLVSFMTFSMSRCIQFSWCSYRCDNCIIFYFDKILVMLPILYIFLPVLCWSYFYFSGYSPTGNKYSRSLC